jgi:hypothetical protein
MNRILNGLHPTFDALSAHADRSELEGARTRVGRHVAGCVRCRDVVAEIRQLGAAARAMTVPGAPARLWADIQVAMSQPRRPEPARPAPRELTNRHGRRRALAGLAGALVAAGIVAVVAWVRPAGLQAAGTSRLTFSPARPVPGGIVTVRYQPTAWMKDASRLILVGKFARPAGSNPMRASGSVLDELADSLGVLTRDSDGAFVTSVQLPADFLAVRLGVLDPVRDESDVDGVTPWMIIGGTPERMPSFASFLAAREIRRGWSGGGEGSRPRQALDVADSLTRYFPHHPAGWAFSRSYGVARGRFDVLRFFESAERKYASMFDELWPKRGLDAERLHDMVEFAYGIDEPNEVLRWSARLAEEHPEDPRALVDLAGALYEVELRMPPALGDSIRRWMPALDRAYRAAPSPNEGFGEALRLANAYGDSTTQALWRSRTGANVTGNIWLLMRLAEPLGRDSVVAELHARLGRGCVPPAGRLPLAQSVGGWRRVCELHRSFAYGYLSAESLRHGRARLALAEADSALVATRRGKYCAPSRGYFDHALAALALGDTAMAERDFIFLSAWYPAGPAKDTARAHLGARFDQARYVAGADSARRAARACQVLAKARDKSRERRLGS